MINYAWLRVKLRNLRLNWQIGYFLLRAPRQLAALPLPKLLERLRRAPRPTFADAEASLARVARTRHRWLQRPGFRRSDTCYMRALTVYRFLDASGRDLRIHYGVEHTAVGSDLPRGHAWVSLDGRLLEPPLPVVEGRVREIFAYPADESPRRTSTELQQLAEQLPAKV
jgi:hypothetical protein